MENKLDAIIIGGGLTGLTIAHKLVKAGKECLLAESAERPGGVIGSREKDGFVYETGPNTGVFSTPELVQLFDDLEGKCRLETADPSSKKRLIWKGDKWRAMPSGLFSAVGTPLFSLYDKFRILGEPFRKPGQNPDESVAELVKRRMGKSFLDYAVDPFISGVYAGDPARLITRYALPKLYRLEQNYGSFIGGAIKKRREPKTELEKRASREVFSAEGGLGKLVEALAESIGHSRIITGASDLKVEKTGDAYIVRSGQATIGSAPFVVTTFGGKGLRELLPFVNGMLMDSICSLNYARVVQVAAGFREWKGIQLDSFGGLVPSKEEKDVLGILFPSAIFENRAPRGGALLSVFLGGYKNKAIVDLDDSSIEEIVIKALAEMMGTGYSRPDLLEIFRYPMAIPQYEITSGERFRAIEKIEDENRGLVLAGNIRNGIGIADRVAQASSVADMIIDQL